MSLPLTRRLATSVRRPWYMDRWSWEPPRRIPYGIYTFARDLAAQAVHSPLACAGVVLRTTFYAGG